MIDFVQSRDLEAQTGSSAVKWITELRLTGVLQNSPCIQVGFVANACGMMIEHEHVLPYVSQVTFTSVRYVICG